MYGVTERGGTSLFGQRFAKRYVPGQIRGLARPTDIHPKSSVCKQTVMSDIKSFPDLPVSKPHTD